MIDISDLDRPLFSESAQSILKLANFYGESIELSTDYMVESVSRKEGLDNFGNEEFLERLDLILKCYREENNIPNYGIAAIFAQIEQLLVARLRFFKLIKDHPEIHDIELEDPIIISGLGRTGSTFLHNAIASDPRFRSLPFWESNEPFPSSVDSDNILDRMKSSDNIVSIMDTLAPHMRILHEISRHGVHEEIHLLAMNFSSLLFETFAPIPTWRDFFDSSSQVEHYSFLKLLLKGLTFLRGPKRWVLKCPQHMLFHKDILEVFPGATFVETSRDLGQVKLSLATMMAYSQRLFFSEIDPIYVGGYWADRVDTMYSRAFEHPYPSHQSITVNYHELIGNEFSVIRSIYKASNTDLPEDYGDYIINYIDSNKNISRQSIRYNPEKVGLNGIYGYN